MTRRVTRLFRPYRGRLATVLLLIVVSAGLGAVSPFLLRDILDVAIPENRDELLFGLVAGMVGISIVTAITVVTFCVIEVAVEVTTVCTPPMSLAIRDCTSPVRVRVKKASDRRWRCR